MIAYIMIAICCFIILCAFHLRHRKTHKPSIYDDDIGGIDYFFISLLWPIFLPILIILFMIMKISDRIPGGPVLLSKDNPFREYLKK